MDALIFVATTNMMTNRWDANQDAILFGILSCKLITNGRLHDIGLEVTQTQTARLHNTLVRHYLDPRFHFRRSPRALFARFRRLKQVNREQDDDESIFSDLWKHFLQITGYMILLKPIFKSSNRNLTETEIENFLKTDADDLIFKSPRLDANRRCNSWSELENEALLGSVLAKFHLTGSLFPPRRNDDEETARGNAWKTVHDFFKLFKEQNEIIAPNRNQSAIERHFKELKRYQRDKLVHYFISFYLKEQSRKQQE